MSAPWSQAQEDKLRAMAAQGQSRAVIAAALGLTSKALDNRMFRLGVTCKRGRDGAGTAKTGGRWVPHVRALDVALGRRREDWALLALAQAGAPLTATQMAARWVKDAPADHAHDAPPSTVTMKQACLALDDQGLLVQVGRRNGAPLWDLAADVEEEGGA
jgi:hypothetical protein